MTATTGRGRSTRFRGWLPLLAAGVLYTVVLCVVVVLRAERSTDFRDYWETALHFRETGQISSDLGVHNYLPFFAIFMLPWSLLPLKVAIAGFTLLSMGLLAITVALVETLLNQGLERRPRRATLAAVVLMLPYVHSCGVLGAVGVLVLFLVVATWFLVERGREWEAGIALGFAALVKLLPLVLVVFFLIKGRWRVAAVTTAVFVVLGFGLPLGTLGYEETVRQHREFYERAVRDHSAFATIHSDKPRKAKYSNNALPIVLRRVLSPVNADPSDAEPQRKLYVNAVDLPRGVIWWVYLVLMAGVLVVSLAIAVRGPAGWPPETLDAAVAVRAQFGVWCCLMLIAAPLLWTHYLPLAYWPLALLADRAERTGHSGGRPLRLALVALLVWLVCAALLAWPAARAVGAQLLAVVFVWLATVLLATRAR